jgi:anti-anti-sigma factor
VSTPFSIRESVSGAVVRLELAGEIDLANIVRIRDCVHGHLGAAPTSEVVADLSATTFIDSVGVGMLVGCRRAATEAGKVFTAEGAVGVVAVVLDTMGLTTYLGDRP